MAEGYSYPVLVEFEKTNSSRLKNKLIKYFQSKKSNGGDCEVECEPGSTTALLRFRRKEDQKNVLTKQEHQINLDEGVLKMTVRLPSGQRDLSDKSRKKVSYTGTNKWSTAKEHNPMDEGHREAKGNDGDSADEELCSTSTVLGNVSESVTQEFLEMLVENILRDISPANAAKNYILELIPDISSAVVTFEKGTVNSEFIERCPKNRMFTRKGFSIRPLETTNRVVAGGFSDCSEDILHLYFESKGGDVEDVKLNEAEKSAVITFKDCKAIRKIMSMKHNIKKQEVKVYPFYKSLGVALYGKDKTSPKLPAVISKPANKPVLGYVTDKKAALESVRHDLEKHFFNITQKQSAVSPSLLKQKVNQALTKNWTIPEGPVGKGQREAIGKDGDSADEEQWSTSAVIENIPESITQEFLEMIVENILRDPSSPTASQDYILELIPDISSAVVTFQGGKVNREFIDRCPKNRMFTRKGFSIRPLETTRRVVVEGVLNFSEDMLHLYFESKGGDIEDVKLNETEQSAVITFKDHQDVKKVMSMKHSIKKQEVKVYPYYKSLGVALYGKDKPSPKLPASISEPIDNAMLRYLAENKAALETIRCDLEKHFCIITLEKSAVRLSALPLLLKQKEAKVIIKEWANSVRSAFSQSVSKFKSINFPLESEVWEESVQKIKEKLQKEDVVVVPDKTSGNLYMVGLVNEVNTLEKPVSEVLSRIGEKVRREKLSKTQEINLPPSIFFLISQDGIQDKLLKMYPELKLSYDQKKKALKVTGLVEEITTASQEINNAMFALKRQNLELDKFLLDMLKEEQQEEATDVLLTAYGLKAALEISPQRVQLVVVSDKDLMSAQDHLSQILKSEYIKVEDNDVLKKPEWQQLVHQLEKANSVSGMRTQIKVHHQQVVVSGQMDNVDKVSSEIDDFLTQNAHVEEFVAVKANVVIEYLKGQAPWLKQLEGGVDVSFGKEEIILSGCRNAVHSCISIVKDSLSSVYFDSLKVTKPGVKKLFLDKESIYVNLIKTETGCLVQLIGDSNKDYKDVATVQVQKPIFKIQTSNGREIVVSKADICSYSVDAVVNPSTDDLKHNGGLALAISKAAGPQLQAECDTIINLKGKLRPGDCVVTNAGGSLRCKKVIHAVGPSFDPNKPKKAEAQLRRAVKESLDLAEKRSCFSVALPAISRNLGFSLSLCLSTIVTTVKEYCDERHDDLTLKAIHLVDNDDSVAIGMVAFVKQEFGNQGAGVAPPKPLPKVSPKPPLIKLALPDHSLCRAQTKEGLKVVLKKGNIEDAKTDVILDPLPGDLLLNKWAISNAISNAAGPKLQQLVHSQKTSGAAGDVIVTDSCNLKSKQVFHAIAPNWDDGKGASEKILSGIFKDCLDLAEKTGLTSISFPTVGTGKLGFPKDLVASLMLDKTLEFSSQRQSKNLKKVVVILYPGNTEIIKVFTDEFKKKFPSATAPSAAKGSLPANSSQSKGKFCKVVSSSGMHETKLGKVTVQVVTGDITKETTDIIVNSSNDNFTLKSGVSKAILDAAGPAIVDECTKLASQPHSGMIMTAPGSLKSSKILHMVGKTNPSEIHQAVKEALQLCVKNSHTSVSFPAIGTGQGNVAAKAVADSMLDAVIDVMSQNTSSSLTLIRIVIFQQNMLKDFCSSMQEREVPDPKDKAGFLQNVGQKIKAIFIPESPEKKQDQKVFDFETIEVEPTLFHICGDSQNSIDAAKKKINDLISDQQGSMEITDNDILNLSLADCQRIVDIQKSMGVSIKHHINNGQASIVIEGLNKDVLQASKEADMMLRKVRGEQELKKKYDLAATVAEWQYQRQGLQYQSVDQVTNYELEHALEKGITSVKVTIQGSNYTVQMPKGPATDSQGITLQIRRIDKLKADDVPEFWEPMPAGQTCHSVPIQATSPEYAEVLNLFQATCKRAVTKIERIQNPAMWKSLQIRKHDMEVRNNHQNNEKRLFHGTCETTVPIINAQGFNRSYAGKNATCYGKGSYFAVNASYSSNDTYSKPNQNGEKFMYLCRVLTGDYTLAQQDMITPPPKGGSDVYLYDSVVDNLTKPNMFVVFHDSHAYPEYLITFK
ncbi:protein mono-ADP-ribosyltransferase PARP14-like [Cyprinodon tularosa]|uniref:protein mono-ADP-ribosyltransferase PARP14-like n=1 Tax=Cyprinodon tularosa TaxID=77115 RepID=UPI0018E28DD2|nr:protein mono-ADP-ribosyltransferase PARP14-like [Cyprinodon tularosa]